MLKSHLAAVCAAIAATACQATAPSQTGQIDAQPDSSVPEQVEPISATERADWDTLSGTYEIIAVRRATETAAPLDAVDASVDPRGETLTISTGSVEMEGASCDAWTVAALTGPEIMDIDPMLDDLRLPFLEVPETQSGRAYDVRCEGEHVLTIYKADPRAIAIPWDNGASYLIAEKPLTEQEVERFQEHLLDMKFQSGPASSKWSTSGLIGLRAYYAYRTNAKGAYIFERPAITQSLLQELHGLPNEE